MSAALRIIGSNSKLCLVAIPLLSLPLLAAARQSPLVQAQQATPVLDIPVPIEFPRDEWAKLRSNTPLTLSEADLTALRGVTEQVSMADVVDVYLPLSRLLNLHFRSARALSGVKDEFLGRLVGRRPYVIGIATGAAVHFLVARAKRAGRAQTDLTKELVNLLTDTLDNLKPLKAMGAQQEFVSFFDRRLHRLRRSLRRQVVTREALRNVVVIDAPDIDSYQRQHRERVIALPVPLPAAFVPPRATISSAIETA